MIWRRLRRAAAYLWSKLPELFDLGPKDALLAKLVLDIHRKRSHTTAQMVALHGLEPVHALDRPEVLAKVEERCAALRRVEEDWRRRRQLRRDDLMQVLPSVSGFKALATDDGRYITFEGNGRLAALQRVFTPADGLEVEVEVYHIAEHRKILRRARRVQRRNRVGPFAVDGVDDSP